jgi:hypothetical protein
MEATSSACARLSSWHGPAITAIGSALPNVTWPAETVRDAVVDSVIDAWAKALILQVAASFAGCAGQDQGASKRTVN